MKVCKEVFLFVGCWVGSLLPGHAFLQPLSAAVEISIDAVPAYVCAGSSLSLHASIANVEGLAQVRIAAGNAAAFGTGMGAASTTLSVDACKPGLLTVYFSFGDHGSYSSNVVVIGIDSVNGFPGGPICAPAPDPIQYVAYPTDAAGYGLCSPQWAGPNVIVDPQDPWRASARCDKGGYYYAIVSFGQDPPCRIWESSDRIMACEIKLRPAWGQDYGQPYIFPNVCRNAQPAFARAKYRVEILPDDTTATVSLAEDSVQVGLSSQKVASQGTFYAIADELTGTYRLRVAHSDLPVCTAEAEGVVFRFELNRFDTGQNTPSQTRGVGTFNAAAGTVRASTPDTSAAGHGAILSRVYEARIETVPADSFAGRVRQAMKVEHTLLPSATIYKNATARNGTLALSASLGIVRVTIASSGVHSIATAAFNASVQVGNSAPVDAGGFTYNSDSFIVPLLWATKTFGGRPVVQTLYDVKRLFQVGHNLPGIPIQTTIGVLCVRRDGIGTATVNEATGTGQVEIEAAEDEYEIVP